MIFQIKFDFKIKIIISLNTIFAFILNKKFINLEIYFLTKN